MFKHKDVHKCTWHQDTLDLSSVTNFVIVLLDLWLYILDTQVKREAELLTGHHLVVSWITWQGSMQDRPGTPTRILRVCWDCLAVPPVYSCIRLLTEKSFHKFQTLLQLSTWALKSLSSTLKHTTQWLLNYRLTHKHKQLSGPVFQPRSTEKLVHQKKPPVCSQKTEGIQEPLSRRLVPEPKPNYI